MGRELDSESFRRNPWCVSHLVDCFSLAALLFRHFPDATSLTRALSSTSACPPTGRRYTPRRCSSRVSCVSTMSAYINGPHRSRKITSTQTCVNRLVRAPTRTLYHAAHRITLPRYTLRSTLTHTRTQTSRRGPSRDRSVYRRGIVGPKIATYVYIALFRKRCY
jgi:hypothetical protein